MALELLAKLVPNQREIIDRHCASYPVKLGQLARELGVSVRLSKLETGISGQIKCENNIYLIRVNRFDSRERQRFTIAHELAHYLLHREIIDSSPNGIRDNVLYRSGEPRAVEYEANKLAAEIVMPRKLIDQRLREFNETVTDEVIERLAEEFQVSKAAMEVRLG